MYMLCLNFPFFMFVKVLAKNFPKTCFELIGHMCKWQYYKKLKSQEVTHLFICVKPREDFFQKVVNPLVTTFQDNPLTVALNENRYYAQTDGDQSRLRLLSSAL